MKKTGKNKAFYPRLALENIRKNGKFYYPYLITCIFTIAMFYIISFLSFNTGLDVIRGGESLRIILKFGMGVIGIFSFIFLIYSNSFLTKRRKREFGIYNILGMEKKHIAKIMVIENIYTTIGTLIAGILSGIVFSRLMLMILSKMVRFDSKIKFDISVTGILITVAVFVMIFMIILIGNLIAIGRSKTIELLSGSNVGEKEPKTKLLIAILGVTMLVIGYYLAMTTESATEALKRFYIAVLFVIVGTYFLFIAGSIAILKILKNNKKFYYKVNNFTAVSGMIYRMKKNATGLASICILSTMVLVVVSTTVSMYAGVEDEMKYRYPNDMTIEKIYRFSEVDNIEGMDESNEDFREIILNTVAKTGIQVKHFRAYEECTITTTYENGKYNYIGYYGNDDTHEFHVISAKDYENLTGEKIELNSDEVYIYSADKKVKDEFTIGNYSFKVKGRIAKFDMEVDYMRNMHLLVVKDSEVLRQIYLDKCDKLGITAENSEDEDVKPVCYMMKIDFNASDEKISGCYSKILDACDKLNYDVMFSCRAYVKDEFYTMYGGLLFIGIFLGILFLSITVLIIYYKQITEGYEDKERFDIMQKVGMSHSEVKKSIKTQVLMVFMLPIVAATIHVAGAFKMIKNILMTLNLKNDSLFIRCTLGTIGIFVIVYAVVYLLTSKVYYNIVENKK